MSNKNPTIKKTVVSAYQNYQKGNFKVAENLYKKILKVNPNHFGSNFYLGTLLVQVRNLSLAKSLLQKAVQINPNYAPAHNNLGGALKELGEYQKAMNCCERAIQIDPNYADAHNNFGAALKESGEYQKAISYCQKAIQIRPNLNSAHINLGLIFQELGEYQKAIECYKKLSQVQPNSANAHQNLGKLYMVLGDIQGAIGSYKDALKYEPENLVYYYHLIELKHEILDLKLRNKIDRILNDRNCTKLNLAYGNFLLSKYAQKSKNYKKEFNYLLKGHKYYFESEDNVKNKKNVQYWLNELPNVKELLNFNKFKKNIKKTNYKIKPIFIVGVPRSGSTLVEKIIASGTKVIPTGEELGIIGTFVKEKLIKKQSSNFKIEESQLKLSEMYKQKRLIHEKNDYTFTDKTLENFFYIGLIKEIFPHAKVINCKRNPLSSIMSILQNNLPGVPWAHNLKHIFKYFDIYYEFIYNFKKKFPNFIFDLDLDKLINNPETESQKLMKFCGLPWHKKCLEFYKRKDLISKTTSNIQIRKAINKDSTKKYLPYKKFLSKYGDKNNWFY